MLARGGPVGEGPGAVTHGAVTQRDGGGGGGGGRSTSDSSLEGTPTDPPESTRSPPSPPAVRKACRETIPDISTSAPDPVLRLKNLPQRTLLWP
ncbi:hypothetical protein MJG53_013606 [Ovis ammon polii x Ovis aries]|uniref:Uncharacterized protein n=1 Tax=Ovis ammon polii x Ovis aries TaxID=2918886 RepID=A0ACB9UJC6_9CETA|nr:hypothetical protein MJT46_013223 [Ovis ammon polii x Ovis aries]KAI4571500.1 hypothetical protein MJG53_013606 [Ovis ammon polii x Ovis aries]